MDYLDLGSSDSSEDERGPYPNPMAVLDSDEEERYENNRILKMLSMKSVESDKSNQKVLDFEAEMEAELDRRASFVETSGGMEHQRSLSRSSSSSSLSCLPLSKSLPALTGQAALTQAPGPSCLKKSSIVGDSPSPAKGRKKAVNFAIESNSSGTLASTGPVPDENIPGGSSTSADGNFSVSEFYDKVYFDSDESEGEEEVKESRNRKRKFVSNEDLFYDPNSDAADQAWIDKQRRNYCSPRGKNVKIGKHLAGIAASKEQAPSNSELKDETNTKDDNPDQNPTSNIPLPKTDAVLNCPACFTLLCMDCQRHEFYAGQYRAMFVINCKIDRSETLTVPLKNMKNRSKKGKSNTSASMPSNMTGNSSDIFFPVRCKICNSQVAVYDTDEIYHFFDCLASHP